VGEHACGAEASTLFAASFCGEAGSPSLKAGEDVTKACVLLIKGDRSWSFVLNVELCCSQRKKREKPFGGAENAVTDRTTTKNKAALQQRRRKKVSL
jgi:hypothetical protein